VPRRAGRRPALFSVISAFVFSALTQTETLAVHFEDVDVVGQPVEERAGQTLGAEGFCPFVEWQAAGDHRGAALVALRDQLDKFHHVPDLVEKPNVGVVDSDACRACNIWFEKRIIADSLSVFLKEQAQRAGGVIGKD